MENPVGCPLGELEGVRFGALLGVDDGDRVKLMLMLIDEYVDQNLLSSFAFSRIIRSSRTSFRTFSPRFSFSKSVSIRASTPEDEPL